MLCIRLENTDPYFCLAAEEFLLKNFADDIFLLWQSHDTVVVGKHQNTMGEINYRYIRENGIRVARRISGGGTVFHDSGNVNFTFIKNVSGSHEISFSRFTQPVVDVLATLGVTAVTSGRNDLLVNGRKISGNAEHVFNNRVLHHGTLLFNSDLQSLGNAIRVTPGKYHSKAVQSNRSVVANISEFLINQIPIESFIDQLMFFQLKTSPENRFFYFSENETTEIEKLAREKFKTNAWNFGYSPAYTFTNEVVIDGESLIIKIEVEKGIIQKAEISQGFYTEENRQSLSEFLCGNYHDYDSMRDLHKMLGIAVSDDLLYAWF